LLGAGTVPKETRIIEDLNDFRYVPNTAARCKERLRHSQQVNEMHALL